ncbi:MAG: AAA family ATPase [Lachnoclostridium sp.]|nr:AAA family ATPase [Lachnoclostridium sp.]
MIYKAKDTILDRYTVLFPIKEGAYAESYRVKDAAGKRYFFKLIDRSRLQPEQIDDYGRVREIEIVKDLAHPCLPAMIESGEVTIGGKEYEYLVNKYVPSETLADRLQRAQTLKMYDIKAIARGVLSALTALHENDNPVIHNEVTALNVLMDLSVDDPSAVCLIDFGYARHTDEAHGQSIEGLNWFYLAPERFDGASTVQSDLYSVGALLYQLTFGLLPWFCDLSTIAPEKRKQYILRQKHTALLMPVVDKFELDDRFLNILRKALAADVDERFQSAREFLDAIEGKGEVIAPSQNPATADDRRDAFSASRQRSGNGFEDVAGMTELKEMLRKRVLNILRDTEKAKRYKLQIPNGILFYGPPGCGKSFLAEKFAEEAGYNFKLVKASDLASIYVHGSQEKIGQLFDEARKNAPTILCFDEFDALVPARGTQGAEHQSGEVNEFLTQLNNCGETGVFVIASTNRPDMIDQAVLRRGRIDQVIFIPVPDAESRAAMFELHLKGRPFDTSIDYSALAALTENYVASDIAYVVNEAAARAAFADEKITSEHLEEVISECRPSLNEGALRNYDKLREKMEGIVESRRRIGF